MSHQVKCKAKIRSHPNPARTSDDVFALLMEMGTGKTKVAVDDWGERVDAKELDSLVVLAPAGVYRNWDRDDRDDPGELRKQLDPALYERAAIVPWVSGAGSAHLRRLSELVRTTGRPRVLTMNVEALSSVEKARALLREFLSSGRCEVVIDESTAIKNPSARRTKHLSKILGEVDIPVRRIMTGQPTPRSPLDLYAQFEFLDWRILGFRSYFAFRARYAVIQKKQFGDGSRRPVPIVVGYRNLDELHQKIEPYSFRVLKQDCLDLPPKTYLKREVPLTPEQERAYREMRHFATVQLGDGRFVTATEVIVQMVRLHQILCGFTVTEAGETVLVPSRRVDSLLEVLEEVREKAVIWCSYDYSVREIVARLTKEFGPGSVAAFWGGNRSTRLQEEARFKAERKCRWMVATPDAGGRGNQWQVADTAVYHSNRPNLDHRLQSEDRTHRQGLVSDKMTYVDLVAPGTVDDKIIRGLRAGIDLAAVITGDSYKEWLI